MKKQVYIHFVTIFATMNFEDLFFFYWSMELSIPSPEFWERFSFFS